MATTARISTVALLGLAACRPDLDDPASLVRGARILAVRGEPPESKPGAKVAYDVLVVSPAGTTEDAQAYWAYCLTPKPLSENDAVNTVCWKDAYLPFGGPAVTITATTPKDSCKLFGPDTPPGDYRPRDPDVTGGYFQPVRVAIPELAGFGFERITCNLPNTSADVALDFQKRYHPNQNPVLTELGASVAGAPVALDQVPAGASVRLSVGWTPESVEIYPVLDVATQRLVDRRESMRVSWFVTAGELETDRTGRTADETETTTDDVWTAPAEPGTVHVWVVLRDARGGVDFAAEDIVVR